MPTPSVQAALDQAEARLGDPDDALAYLTRERARQNRESGQSDTLGANRSVWDDLTWVNRTPIFTFLLLEGANVGQMVRMWSEGTAEGQSLIAWFLVLIALLAWYNFYRVTMPEGPAKRWAIWATGLGIVMKVMVLVTVLYFRL